MDTERIAKLETQVEAIKEDVSELKGDVKEIHSRITTGNREILEKIENMDCRIEERMKTSASAAKQQHEDIQKALQEDLRVAVSKLDVDLNKVSDRVDVLERWRWMIVGAAILGGYLIGNFGLISKIFGMN